MSSEPQTVSRQRPSQEPIENWCDDTDKFGTKVGTTDGFWGKLIQFLFGGDDEITFKNKVDRVAQVVAHLVIPPVIMAWRESGEDENQLRKIQAHFVDEWGYNEKTLGGFVEKLKEQGHISMAKCAVDFWAEVPIMEGDISVADLAKNFDALTNRILRPCSVSPQAFNMISQFIQVLQKQRDEGVVPLLVHDHCSLARRVEVHAKIIPKVVEREIGTIKADLVQCRKSLSDQVTELNSDVGRHLIEQREAVGKNIAGVKAEFEQRQQSLNDRLTEQQKGFGQRFVEQGEAFSKAIAGVEADFQCRHQSLDDRATELKADVGRQLVEQREATTKDLAGVKADFERHRQSLGDSVTDMKIDVEKEFIKQREAFAQQMGGLTNNLENTITRLKGTILLLGSALVVSLLVIGVMLGLRFK